jgi:formiminotetrahydrofolate cyclodeaminase
VAHGHNAAKRGIAVTLDSFLAEVADRTPAPGGGAAAGAGCALGAALAEMAARFAGLDDPGRTEALAAAQSAAADVPLAIAEAAASVAALAREVAAEGKPGLRGDALAGSDIATGAARAAARLVEINLAGAADDPRVARAREAVARSCR